MIYNQFANVYDSLMYDFDYDKVYNQIMKILKERGAEGTNVLELACGTGSLAEKFGREYRIDAFDLSEDMLAIAQNKLINNRNVRLFKSDMRNFNMGKRYSICLCICDSLNYILEADEVQKIFSNVYEHLEENGVFIFDMNTEFKFSSMDEVYIDEVDEVFYVWENFYDEVSKTNTYGVNFFIEEDDDLYRRVYEEHIEKAYSKDEIIAMLEKAGFNDIKVYNDYTFNEELDNAHRLVFTAGRK